MKFGLSQIHKPTPAKMVKLGASLIAVSGAISGYSLTQNIPWIGYVGLGCMCIGTLIVTFFGDNKEETKEN